MPKCQMKSDPKLKFDFFKFMKQKFKKFRYVNFKYLIQKGTRGLRVNYQ